MDELVAAAFFQVRAVAKPWRYVAWRTRTSNLASGEVLAEGGVQPSVTFADVELQRLDDVRRQVPSLRHDRPFDVVYAGDALPDEVAS